MKTIKILQLYPEEMNIYGDRGNLLAITHRLKKLKINYEIIDHNSGKIPQDIDILLGGGGQDSGQFKIKDNLKQNKAILKNLAQNDVPMLIICGMYQLFGNYFLTNSKEKIDGIGIFDIYTEATDTRLIGNIAVDSDKFGQIIGYENHSGQTYLDKNATALGKTKRGQGNNVESENEGCIYKNVIGTYLHGSILPKNPKITDFLISQALKNKHEKDCQLDINDKKLARVTEKARKQSFSRPR